MCQYYYYFSIIIIINFFSSILLLVLSWPRRRLPLPDLAQSFSRASSELRKSIATLLMIGWQILKTIGLKCVILKNDILYASWESWIICSSLQPLSRDVVGFMWANILFVFDSITSSKDLNIRRKAWNYVGDQAGERCNSD